MKNFGFSYIGKWTIVKLNVKLDETSRDHLISVYSDNLTIYKISKGLTRIEGCLPSCGMQYFVWELDRAKLLTQQNVIAQQLSTLTSLLYDVPNPEITDGFDWENCSI
jgi:hypothetical protein